jgi:hypothetical protein
VKQQVEQQRIVAVVMMILSVLTILQGWYGR